MIERIQGRLESIEGSAARLKPMVGGEHVGLVLEVLLSGYAAVRLQPAVGSDIELITLHYYESVNQGAMFLPRLAGFLDQRERQMFLLLTSCKGIGYRKALRAMELDPARLAGAIADRDVALLQSLPEIGKRTAESIVVALKDRVGPLLEAVAAAAGAAGSGAGAGGNSDGVSAAGGDGSADAGTTSGAAGGAGSRRQAAREALEALVQLGESRADAMRWIDQILDGDDPPQDTAGLLSRVFQLRSGR